MAMRPSRARAYGCSSSSSSGASAVGSGRASGDEAKLENSAASWRSSRTWSRTLAMHSSTTGPSGRPRSACTRRRCSALSWMGVSGFLMSWATWRAISAQASRRLVRSSLSALALEVVGHAVERLHQAAELVGRRHQHPGIEIAGGEPLRGAREPADRVRDSLGGPVADRRSEQDEGDGGEQHAPVELVELSFDAALAQGERHADDRRTIVDAHRRRGDAVVVGADRLGGQVGRPAVESASAR